MEWLTDALQQEALRIIEHIDDLGGAAQAIAWVQDEIHRVAWQHQRDIESGERVVVGVNAFAGDDDGVRIDTPAFHELEEEQCGRLARLRQQRDPAAVRSALDRVRDAAAGSDNLLPPMVLAVKAGATLGEISDVLRSAWGTFRGVASGGTRRLDSLAGFQHRDSCRLTSIAAPTDTASSSSSA